MDLFEAGEMEIGHLGFFKVEGFYERAWYALLDHGLIFLLAP